MTSYHHPLKRLVLAMIHMCISLVYPTLDPSRPIYSVCFASNSFGNSNAFLPGHDKNMSLIFKCFKQNLCNHLNSYTVTMESNL